MTLSAPCRLTVAAIVRNAADEISRTLASASGIADEIIVLDTGSTDESLSVAESFAARTFRRAWDDDFSAARNALLGQATGNWVLWLDAGEVLPERSQALLSNWLQQRPDASQACLLPVVWPLTPGQIGREQAWQVRLHPARRDVRFAGRVRESLDGALDSGRIALAPLEARIERPPSAGERQTREHKARRNISLADRAIAECGSTADLHNCLGEAWAALGEALLAVQHYHRALELAPRSSREALEAYYGLLSCLDATATGREAQLALALKALADFPLDAQLLCATGGYLQALGQLPLAIRSLDVAFRHGQIELRVRHLPDIQEIAAVSAATAHLQAGDAPAACSLLEAAAALFPHSQRVKSQLEHARHLPERRFQESSRAAAPG